MIENFCKQVAFCATCFGAGFLLCLFCGRENEGELFLRNSGWFFIGVISQKI
jgi:hypothetical protein